MPKQFGPWAFAGMVVILGYAAVDTFAPQYSNLYLITILLSVVIYYFGKNGRLPEPGPGRPGKPF